MLRSRLCALVACLLLALAGCGKVSSDGGDGDNGAPVAMAAELSTWMITPVTGQLEGEDPDGDALVFSAAQDPAGGTLVVHDDGSFRYTPAKGTGGSDSFTFAIDDGNGGTDEATVDIAIADLTDGTPDAEFGDGGATLSDYGGATDSNSSVIVAEGGRIVASGTTGGNYAVVAGFSTRGVLLSSWGEGGSGTTMLGVGDYDAFGDVVQQPDGRLVAVGQTLDAANYNTMILGLTPDNGYLDSGFNGGGTIFADLGGGESDAANAVAVLSDGRLLVAGYISNGTDTDFSVARYSKDGMLDDTFGSGGHAVVDFGGFEQVDDIAIDGDGQILLVGEVSNDMGIARLTAEGDPDDSFGDGGKLTLDRGENDRVNAVVVGPDGAIYVGGSSQDGGVWSMAVAKLTDAGELDDSFGQGGWGRATAADADVYAYDMILLPNHMLLLVGSWVAEKTEAAAARIDSSGQLDTGFGDGGFYHQAIGTGGDDQLTGVALQADGKVVAVGSSQNATLDALLIRLGW
jgi:uncharacterized delta-60 repeat protein